MENRLLGIRTNSEFVDSVPPPFPRVRAPEAISSSWPRELARCATSLFKSVWRVRWWQLATVPTDDELKVDAVRDGPSACRDTNNKKKTHRTKKTHTEHPFPFHAVWSIVPHTFSPLSHTHTHSLSLSLSLSFVRARSLSRTHTHSLSHTHTRSASVFSTFLNHSCCRHSSAVGLCAGRTWFRV